MKKILAMMVALMACGVGFNLFGTDSYESLSDNQTTLTETITLILEESGSLVEETTTLEETLNDSSE